MHRYFIISLAFLLLGVGSLGCGGGSWNFEVVGTSRDPGAEGTIQVERIEGGNQLVTVSFEHMTPPSRLGSNITTFVLWFRDPRGRSTKESNIEYDADSRTGRATATTPMRNFMVVVTAERNGEVTEPSQNVIFTQRVNTE